MCLRGQQEIVPSPILLRLPRWIVPQTTCILQFYSYIRATGFSPYEANSNNVLLLIDSTIVVSLRFLGKWMVERFSGPIWMMLHILCFTAGSACSTFGMYWTYDIEKKAYDDISRVEHGLEAFFPDNATNSQERGMQGRVRIHDMYETYGSTPRNSEQTFPMSMLSLLSQTFDSYIHRALCGVMGS